MTVNFRNLIEYYDLHYNNEFTFNVYFENL